MRPADVVEVLAALEAAAVRYFLVGGWGVDALLGHQTRRHDDLDVVLDRFDEAAELARAALHPLGYDLARRERADVALPDRLFLTDGGGRSVDLVSIDLERLGPVLAAMGANTEKDQLFTTGTVDGQTVACVSASLQRALRAGFPPRPVDRHDLRVLSRRRA
jgi:lincosamide nucleotidyltransferase A/C/D/E